MSFNLQKIDISQIAVTAKQVADQIGALVSDKKVDPDNLVVMVGECHTQLSHNYFEKKLIENLHDANGLKSFFIEDRYYEQKNMDRAASRHPYLKTMHGALNKDSVHGDPKRFPIQHAFKNNIPVHCVDSAIVLNQMLLCVGNILPKNFQNKYRDNKMVADLCTRYADMFSDEQDHALISKQGALKRNLYMMNNMLDITGRKPGMSYGVVGAAHILNMFGPQEPSLPEMLHANGKDVVNVVLHMGQNIVHAQCEQDEEDEDLYALGLEGFADAQNLQQTRLVNSAHPRYFINHHIEIENTVSENLSGLVTLHKANQDKIPRHIQVMTTAKAFFG